MLPIHFLIAKTFSETLKMVAVQNIEKTHKWHIFVVKTHIFGHIFLYILWFQNVFREILKKQKILKIRDLIKS